MTCPYIIYGSHSVYCGYCHKSPRECRCEDFGDFMADINARLAARRAVVATANAHQGSITITSTGTTTATACKRCGLLIYQGISHMCPDFDEPMEFVDSKRLRELEALEAAVTAHQATCPTCGAPMPGGVPAADPPTMPAPAPDANIAGEPTPSGYMSRPKML